MLSFIAAHLSGAIVTIAVVTVVSLLVSVWSLTANATLRRRFKRYKDIHETADLDRVYERTVDEVGRLREELAGTQRALEELRATVRKKVSTARIRRFNAFSDLGSDLSYAVAFLDDDQDGVVLSSIYGREESRSFGKPVESGQSSYPLTDEELQAIADIGQPVISRRVVKA